MWIINDKCTVTPGPEGIIGDQVQLGAIKRSLEDGEIPRITFSILIPDTRFLTGDQIGKIAKERLIQACRDIVAQFGA